MNNEIDTEALAAEAEAGYDPSRIGPNLIEHPPLVIEPGDDLVRLYRDTYAREAQERMRQVCWAGPEPSPEANLAADAAYWEASRVALGTVMDHINALPRITPIPAATELHSLRERLAAQQRENAEQLSLIAQLREERAELSRQNQRLRSEALPRITPLPKGWLAP